METIFLHPIGLDREIWAGIAPAHAHVLDFPGHGDAPRTDRVTLAGLVDHVVGQLDGPATLVGCSLGGMVALQVAVRQPEAVVSLVLACCNSASRADVMRERAEQTRRLGMAGMLSSMLERWFTPAALATAGHPGVDYARRRLLADDPEVVAQYWEAMAENDVTEALVDLRMPVTFVAGTEDHASTPAVMERSAKRVPGAVLEVVAGPHMLPLEQPEEVRRILGRHFERMSAAPAATVA